MSLSACAMTLTPRAAAPQLNLLGDIFDGEKLKEQTPYENPLLPSLVKSVPATYQLQEKLFSLSGEDFRVRDVAGNVRDTSFPTFAPSYPAPPSMSAHLPIIFPCCWS